MNTACAIQDFVEDTERLVSTLRSLPSNRRFSAETLETVYFMAYHALRQRQHERAMQLFWFLMIYAPTDPRFVAGLAMTHQLASNHEQALQLYSMASFLRPDCPHYTIRMAECFLLLGSQTMARSLLEMAVCRCQEGKPEEAVRQRAKAMLELLVNERVAT